MKCDAIICLCFILPLMTDLCWGGVIHAKACNRTIRTSVGWVHWTGRMGRCVVRIRAPLRDPQVVELRIRRLQVGTLRDSICHGAYVQFSDGIEDLEDDVGRYCGHVTGNATRLFLRKGPELNIVMDSDKNFADKNPVIFSAQFSVLPVRLAMERHGDSLPSAAECSLDCSNHNYQRQCRITSPGFPGVYPRGMRCRISLESTSGRFKIGGISDDIFSLMNYTVQDGCRTENCEDLHVEEDARSSGEESPIETESSDEPRHQRGLKSFDYRLDEDDEVIIGSDVRQRKPKAINGRRKMTEGNRRRRVKSRRGRGKGGRKSSGPKNAEQRFDESFSPSSGLGEKIFEETAMGQMRKSSALFDHRFKRRHKSLDKFDGFRCVGDYLAIYENLNGKIVEISKFCGEGNVPEILSRGRNVIVEFFSKRDGTVMHDGFRLTLQETITEHNEAARHRKNCDFVYKSSDRGTKESIKSFQHWYPPSTLCSYKFVGKTGERVFVQLKIIRNSFEDESGSTDSRRNSSLNYCPGNEITVYNGAFTNDSLAWSYCDILHSDINNIQVPVTSTGNVLLVQYYSWKGSFNGQEFTYGISYKFVKKSQSAAKRKPDVLNETKIAISLKPVNFSALNLTDYENCNCDFSTRIGTFKSWFIVLVVLGVISFFGAVITIVALLMKCLKIRSMENKLLQTPKR
ncbi:uncharacterized protein [Neodiprion pinetum]|uniref:uncharacterized protein n=1 Tax=Neodiprion pinetum TaxID=441929 RepID=UPI001EE0BE2F|nr:uncharacterized protein LOC124219040 [Neodiprion pinetum]